MVLLIVLSMMILIIMTMMIMLLMMNTEELEALEDYLIEVTTNR